MRLVFFAGYIRNRRQLCRELALADGETEQAVLEAAYSRWGERLADHLYGGFAFVFENPESGTLFCVRDQFGLQPFFYMVTGKGELLYGSDINGLVRDPRCRRSVDPEAIQYYMCFGYPAGEKTIWKGIRKLMPGQTLTFRDGKASVSTYYQKAWTPEYECTEEEWTGRIGETLARIIREDRENVDFRSACSFLSGGVDSSYLLAVSGVSRAVGIGYPEENASETFLAAQTAKALGADFSEADVTPEMFFDAIPQMVRRTGLPLADASAAVFGIGCEMAARKASVCYSGEGADEFFAGYRIYLHADKLAQTGGPWHYGCAGVMNAENAARLLMLEHPFSLVHLVKELYEESEGDEHLSRLLRIDCALWLEGDILFAAGCSAKAAGLRLLLPYADRRMFELAARIPSALKQKDGIEKYILRRAAEKHLPAETAFRRKVGFSVPVRKWLRTEPFRGRAESVLFGDRSVRFFDQPLLRQYWSSFQAGNDEAWQIPYAAYVFIIWAMEYGV